MRVRFQGLASVAMAALLLGSNSAQASADEPAIEAAAQAAIVLPSGNVPSQIFGIDCVQLPGTDTLAPRLDCRAANLMEEPSIFVSVADWTSQPTRDELISYMREALHERVIFKAVTEPFAPANDPQATGFRGFYETDWGNRYVWSVLSGGKLTRVTAAVFAPADFQAMIADIELKVFGVTTPTVGQVRTSNQ